MVDFEKRLEQPRQSSRPSMTLRLLGLHLAMLSCTYTTSLWDKIFANLKVQAFAAMTTLSRPLRVAASVLMQMRMQAARFPSSVPTFHIRLFAPVELTKEQQDLPAGLHIVSAL